MGDLLSIDGTELTRTLDSGGRKSDTPIFHPGDRVAHFRVEELIGKGGFGTVYSAFDERLERTVALKIPRQSRMTRFQVDSFIREAQAAAQLRHPNIVAVHEVGRENEVVYLITDYIEGETLAGWSKRLEPNAKQAAAMIAKIAFAIDVAHEKGVIHRDIKPRNILVDRDGNPHITDFGLAKRSAPTAVDATETITMRGQVVGTPAYMSPEQASGHARTADRRADIYSIGVMLYEMLAGRRPFIGDSDFLIDEVIEGDAPRITRFKPNVHSDIEAICLKAIETDADDRFPTASQFGEELQRFINGEPTLTRPPTRWQTARRLIQRHSLSIGLCALILVLASTAAYFAFRTPPIPENKMRVDFKIVPPRADVAMVKVDLNKGYIDYENVIEPVVTDSGCSIDLTPGWYIIEASIPEYGIQEVWRYVPESRYDLKQFNDFDNCNWVMTEDRNVTLRDIVIKKNVLDGESGFVAGEEMCLVTGGQFLAGSEGLFNMDGNPRRRHRQMEIPDFYLGKYEVTVKNFCEVWAKFHVLVEKNFEGEVPEDSPMTNITFLHALDYCEKRGLRLPSFDEYVFAATNGGTTLFPWGDEQPPIDAWQPRQVGQPEFDATKTKPEIHNLYSSVLEWTQEVQLIILSPTRDAPATTSFFKENLNSRLVVGGPGQCVSGELPLEGKEQNTRAFLDIHPVDFNLPGVGFRCAKSVRPRLKTKVFAQTKTADAN